jgi:prophage antirepressor-like protein
LRSSSCFLNYSLIFKVLKGLQPIAIYKDEALQQNQIKHLQKNGDLNQDYIIIKKAGRTCLGGNQGDRISTAVTLIRSATMNSLTSFEFNDNEVRVIMLDGEPWFVAKDIARFFEYVKVDKMLQLVDEEDKQVINPQKMDTPKMEETFNNNTFRLSIINESGLYAVIFNSTKLEAKAFKRWVTSEVLPSIRKTGQYSVNNRKIEPVKVYTPQEKLEMANLAINLLERLNGGTPDLSPRDKIMYQSIINNATRDIDNQNSLTQLVQQEERKLTLTEIAQAVFGVNVRRGSKKGCDAHLGGRMLKLWRQKYDLPKTAFPEKTDKYFNRITTASASTGHDVKGMNLYPREDWHLVGELLIEYGYAIHKGNEELVRIAGK